MATETFPYRPTDTDIRPLGPPDAPATTAPYLPTDTDIKPLVASHAHAPAPAHAHPHGDSFSVALLGELGAPVTANNLRFLHAWQRAEGTKAAHNPLASTKHAGGATRFNSAGVRNYPDFETGVRATADTLRLKHYRAILHGLRRGDVPAEELGREVVASPWGSSETLLRVLHSDGGSATARPLARTARPTAPAAIATGGPPAPAVSATGGPGGPATPSTTGGLTAPDGTPEPTDPLVQKLTRYYAKRYPAQHVDPDAIRTMSPGDRGILEAILSRAEAEGREPAVKAHQPATSPETHGDARFDVRAAETWARTLPQRQQLESALWADAFRTAALNAIPSAGRAVGDIGEAVIHPIQTVQAVASLARGALHLATGHDSTREAHMARQAIQGLKDRYGSVQGFRHAVAEDPAGVALDISSLLGGTGAAARLARAGHAAESLAAAGRAIDPLARSARWAAGRVGHIAPHVLGETTAAGPQAIRAAWQASPAFKAGLKGAPEAEGMVGPMTSDYQAGRALSRFLPSHGLPYIKDAALEAALHYLGGPQTAHAALPLFSPRLVGEALRRLGPLSRGLAPVGRAAQSYDRLIYELGQALAHPYQAQESEPRTMQETR
jgi:hypothetical protein